MLKAAASTRLLGKPFFNYINVTSTCFKVCMHEINRNVVNEWRLQQGSRQEFLQSNALKGNFTVRYIFTFSARGNLSLTDASPLALRVLLYSRTVFVITLFRATSLLVEIIRYNDYNVITGPSLLEDNFCYYIITGNPFLFLWKFSIITLLRALLF